MTPLRSLEPDEETTEELAARETMEFVLRLRAKGIADLSVLRALETVPRRAFAPHRFRDLAFRDVALPIPCGQLMSEPFDLAKILESLSLARGHRALEIGTGSGYGSTLMAKLCDKVVTIDRFRTLSLEAGLRLEALKVRNVLPIWGDGLDLPTELGLFDRIYIDGAIDEDQKNLYLPFLAEGGAILAHVRRKSDGATHLMRIAHHNGAFVEMTMGPSRAESLIVGCSRAL